MKFAALVLLLAVGSQAASLQADAPDQGTLFRQKVKEIADRILAPIDNTAHKASKDQVMAVADSKLAQAIEMGQTAYSAASDATEGIRTSIRSDIQKLQSELSNDADTLKTNVLKHIHEYIAELTTLKDHLETKRAEIEELKSKAKTVVENIGEKVPKNWEETRSSLKPIVDKVQEQLSIRVEEIKQQIQPYINEYMDTAQTYIEDPLNKGTPALEDVRAKVSAYATAILESFNKA